MKKLLLISILLLGRASLFGQCSSCSPVIPVVNGDFSKWDGSFDFGTWPCTAPLIIAPPSVYDYYFSSPHAPNWIRVNGAPYLRHSLVLNTTDGGGGHHCGSTGSQGVAVNYPFLAHGQYNVTLNIRGLSNGCTIPGNAKLIVAAARDLAEPPSASYFVEPHATMGTSSIPILGIGAPLSPTAYMSVFDPFSYSVCSGSMAGNYNQLYIYADQGTAEVDPTAPDEPANFSVEITSVNVSLCNECPTNNFYVSNLGSIDPTTSTSFGAGGLFVHKGISIDGTYFTNIPSVSSLLWARWIEIDHSHAMGNAFLAYAFNGSFFEMLPNPGCEGGGCNVAEITDIDYLLCIGGTVGFTDATPGGVWTSSNPAIASINPTTGVVTGHAVGTITISYTVGDCPPVVKSVSVSTCDGGGKMPSSNVKNNSPATAIAVFPNPAQNSITVTYPCKSAGQLEIVIKDLLGKELHRESVLCDKDASVKQIIDISSFPSGTYLVSLTLNDEHTIKKIVKL